MSNKPTIPPIARHVTRDPLDWEHVEPRRDHIGKDPLGLSPADRSALGLSAVGTTDFEPPTLGGAEAALAEVLARGGAVKPEFRRKR